MKLSDFHYDLPDELIAQFPPDVRGDSRLLALNPENGHLCDRHFSEFVDLIHPGDLLVFNNTRVLPARLYGRKQTGGKIEILVERVLDDYRILSHIRSSKSPRPGSGLILQNGDTIQVIARQGALFELSSSHKPFSVIMTEIGHMPLPPYIDRDDKVLDVERYQTVYADRPGAVAAPTAGLHFTDDMLQRLADKGAEMAYVTLHVGAGTFQPVRVENLDEHQMHQEYLEVPETVVEQVKQTKQAGKRVIAVGTTTIRCLETASAGGVLQPFYGETRLFIRPGYSFQVVDALLTNFHLPESTLLMLVSALGGYDNIRKAYQHAIEQKYRFFSYGDAMWIG